MGGWFALRRLAVLPASWDLETAASVVDRPEADVLRSLHLLTERSLVQRAPADLDGRSRFRLLHTVRAYGREQLAAHDDADAARARLADTRADGDPASHARAEATWALLTFTRGDPESALARSGDALDRAATAGEVEGMLRALTVQANAGVATGDLGGARRAAERIRQLEVSPEVSTFAPVARAVVSVAEVRAALAEGEFDHADAPARTSRSGSAATNSNPV